MKKINYIFLIALFLTGSLNVFAIPKFADNNTKIPPDPIYKNTVIIPKDYILNVSLIEKYNVNNILPADNIYVILNNDFIYKGDVIAQEGSIIKGKFVKKITNNGSYKFKIKFTNIITKDGGNIPISAIFVEENTTGYINSLQNKILFENDSADIIIKQPVTYVIKK